MNKNTDQPTFHLGITMAGAVSAGAYTAGFIDYLLEALAAWKTAKDANNNATSPDAIDKRIPMHNVEVDAIGGASAGGMVSMITALSFFDKGLKPVREKSYKKTGNVLYDSWVFLDDDMTEEGPDPKGKTTFEKMLRTDDLKSGTGAPSLLNSEPIDNIAEGVFKELPPDVSSKNFPDYISEDLRILLTITSLRPVDYVIKFSRLKSKFMDTTPGHRISNHDIVAHFKIDYDADKDKDKFLPFDLKTQKSKDFLIKSTKATGAFPIGLAPRHFDSDFSTDYVQNSLSRRQAFDEKMDVNFHLKGTDFKFTGVDGGTINNEPFDEVIRCLINKHGKHNPDEPKYGTIMIDPFPNFEDGPDSTDDPFQKSILGVLGKLVPTILNQARNKRNDTYGFGLFKLLAFPVKWKSAGKLAEHPPLATGGVGGFGGFLDLEFRMHDFFLGRDNARNFLRGFFFLEYDKDDPSYLFKNVTEESVDAFARTVKDKLTGKEKTYMPIIPDVSFLTGDTNPYFYTVKDFPKLNKKKFEALEKPVRNRVKAIIRSEVDGRVKSWVARKAVNVLIGIYAKKISKNVLKKIAKDFKNRGM